MPNPGSAKRWAKLDPWCPWCEVIIAYRHAHPGLEWERPTEVALLDKHHARWHRVVLHH